MSFLDKYHVVSVLASGETNSFRAQELATGRQVLVHQIVTGQPSPHLPDLMAMIYTYLPGEGTPGTEHFLDSGQEENNVYIVTSDVPVCHSVRGWLQFIADSRSRTAPAARIPTPPQAAKPVEKEPRGQVPSGFQVVARSRKSSQRPIPQQPVAPTPTHAAPPAPPPPTPPTAKKEAQGGFTGMFAALSQDQPVQKTPASPSSHPVMQMPGPPPPVDDGPGEFTQMFQGPDPANANPPAVTPPMPQRASNPPASVPFDQSDGPGEFTSMFTAPSAPANPQAAPPAALRVNQPAAKPPALASVDEPGEFTALFQSPIQSAAKSGVPPAGAVQQPVSVRHPVANPSPSSFPTPPVASSGPGEFTGLFQTGGAPIAPSKDPLSPTPAPPSVPLSSSSKKGSGDFTMMMQGYKSPTTPPPPPEMLDAPVRHASPSDPNAGKRAPGEFTMLFRNPNSQPQAPVVPPSPQQVAHPAAPPSPKTQGPGEYTGLFEAPRTPAPQPQAASQAPPAPGYGYPSVQVTPPATPEMPSYQPPSASVAPPQVSYQSPQAPQFQPPQVSVYAPSAPQMGPVTLTPPQPAAPTGKKPTIFWVMLLAFGCLFLITVILVVYFAVKH